MTKERQRRNEEEEAPLQKAYVIAKIGADTAENEQHFAETLPIGRRVPDRAEPSWATSAHRPDRCAILQRSQAGSSRPWPGKRGGSSDVNAGLQEKRILSEYRWMFEMYQCKEVDANLIYKCITKY